MNSRERAGLSHLGPLVKKLALRAVDGPESIDALQNLRPYFQSRLLPSRLVHLIPVLRIYLDVNLPAIGSASYAEAVPAAAQALFCVAWAMSRSPDVPALLSSLSPLSPSIIQWLLLLLRNYFRRYPLDELVSAKDIFPCAKSIVYALACNPELANVSNTRPLHELYVEVWYRFCRISIADEFLVLARDLVVHAMAKIWKAGPPPPIIREVIGSVLDIGDTVVNQVWWSFEEALAVPVCADLRNFFNKQRLAKYLLQMLQFFTQRRRSIAKIPHHFRCPHRDCKSLTHNTSPDKRGLMEVSPLESAWCLLETLVIASQGPQGVDMVVRLCKAGLLSACMNSGFVRARHSLWPSDAPHVSNHIGFLVRIILTISTISPRALKTVTASLQAIDDAQETLYPPDDEALSEQWFCVRKQIADVERLRQRSREDSGIFHKCMFAECPHQTSDHRALKRCTGCHVARYCMNECQRADWTSHRFQCYLFQCCGSQRQDIGLAGITYYAELEGYAFISLKEHRHDTAALFSELASQQSGPDPMVLTHYYSLTEAASLEARKMSELEPFLQEKCWKEVLPMLQQSRNLCFLSLLIGPTEVIILSPRIALGYLHRLDKWEMPNYSTLYMPSPTPSPHDVLEPTTSI
ncbi:hypothetical protein HGRIS_013521 [Hohenbuehelia grisea]|uniref:MYND-type domain-containing protein n=1 Tax=Hohenbuehelia grisea TaxID=104357 RepID=A0ABR3IVT9_9AGAR